MLLDQMGSAAESPTAPTKTTPSISCIQVFASNAKFWI